MLLLIYMFGTNVFQLHVQRSKINQRFPSLKQSIEVTASSRKSIPHIIRPSSFYCLGAYPLNLFHSENPPGKNKYLKHYLCELIQMI